MSDEMPVILLLDLAAEDLHDEAMVRAQLPRAAPSPRVLRLTDFGATRYRAGAPDNWLLVLSAIDRMLRAARDLDPEGSCRHWVAGCAGLPAWFYVGYRLSKKAIVTLVDRSDAGVAAALPLDPASVAAERSQPYFARWPWPQRPSHAEAPVGLLVSSQRLVSVEQVERVPSPRGSPGAVLEAQASAALDGASLASAMRELDERVAGIRTWYPRCTSLSVFLAGSAALAFLTGRAIHHLAFPDVQVFQHVDHAYELAYETRSARRKHVILFLASNPPATTRVALDDEARNIQNPLARSQHRDRFELQPQLALRAAEIRRHLAVLSPTIVHFGGRGDAPGLVLHGDDGADRGVSPDELAQIFEAAGAPVQVVVLGAWFSDRYADALLAHVDCVVGMPGPIGDDAATSFAVGFYEALGDRAAMQTAYDLGCLAMRRARSRPGGSPELGTRDLALDGASASATDEGAGPRLRVRPGVDAKTLVLAAREA